MLIIMESRAILILLIIFALCILVKTELKEEFRGGRGRGRGGGRGKGRGRGGGRGCKGRGCGSGHKPYRPYRHFRRHNWRRGYNTSIYNGLPYFWGGYRLRPYPTIYNYFPSFLYTPQCRTGCAYLGNGSVGCVNPTNTPDSCIFASDCYGC